VHTAQQCMDHTAHIFILTRCRGQVRYYVQGPPGSGKTSTIVSMVSSILSSPGSGPADQPSAAEPSHRRVLVCAQSNAAVDELTLRLSSGSLDASGKAKCVQPKRLSHECPISIIIFNEKCDCGNCLIARLLCRTASVVRLGVMESTHSGVQALHIDTVSRSRAANDTSAVSVAGVAYLKMSVAHVLRYPA